MKVGELLNQTGDGGGASARIAGPAPSAGKRRARRAVVAVWAPAWLIGTLIAGLAPLDLAHAQRESAERRSGVSNLDPAGEAPALGRPVLAQAESGRWAVAWSEGAQSHWVARADATAQGGLGERVAVRTATTAITPTVEPWFLLGGADGRVRAVALVDVGGLQLIEPGRTAPRLNQPIVSLSVDRRGLFTALDASGGVLTGRFFNGGFVNLSVSGRPISGGESRARDRARPAPGTAPGTAPGPTPGQGPAPGPSNAPAKSEAALQTFRDCSVCPEMVAIPGGAFTIGSPISELGRDADEGPTRTVSVEPFAMGRTEVTVAEYRQFVTETGYRGVGGRCNTRTPNGWRELDVDWRYPNFQQGEDHPVTCVTYPEAQAYVAWLNSKVEGAPYRLPSEAEWEYAARAGGQSRFYWGDDASGADQCLYANGGDASSRAYADPGWNLAPCDDGHVATAPVASYRPNAFNLYDMSGNVFEILEGCSFPDYANGPVSGDPRRDGGDCNRAPLRGGSWFNRREILRSADREDIGHGYRANIMGFRVARVLPDR